MSAGTPTSESSKFRPVFVVGSERSGTTLLAVLLGRHSTLAMTPETHYFRIVRGKVNEQQRTHKELLQRFRANPILVALDLNAEKLEARFSAGPATYANLLQAVLEQYAADHGKPRAGEKTPRHLEHVRTILEWFPEARIICIVRDGRDVVLSIATMPWATERWLPQLCWQWVEHLRRTERWLKEFPRQFMMIRYEDLLRDPEQTLRKVDDFAGMQYEPAQLNPGENTQVADAVIEPWKSDAVKEIDPSRIAGWKKKATSGDIRMMNALMGPELRRCGYDATTFPKTLSTILAILWFRSGLNSIWARFVEKHYPSRRAARRAARRQDQGST